MPPQAAAPAAATAATRNGPPQHASGAKSTSHPAFDSLCGSPDNLESLPMPGFASGQGCDKRRPCSSNPTSLMATPWMHGPVGTRRLRLDRASRPSSEDVTLDYDATVVALSTLRQVASRPAEAKARAEPGRRPPRAASTKHPKSVPRAEPRAAGMGNLSPIYPVVRMHMLGWVAGTPRPPVDHIAKRRI